MEKTYQRQNYLSFDKKNTSITKSVVFKTSVAFTLVKNHLWFSQLFKIRHKIHFSHQNSKIKTFNSFYHQ